MKRGRFELPQERKSRMSRTRRNITLLAIVFGLFAVGYIAVSTGDGSLINSAAISPLGELNIGLFDVSGQLAVPTLSLDVEDVEFVIVSHEQTSMKVNGLDLEPIQGPLVLHGFEGTIDINGKQVLFDGTATSAVIDQIAINGKVAVSSKVTFDQLEIASLKEKKLEFTGTGMLEVVGRGTFTVADALVDMRMFEGSLSFADTMSLTSKARKVVIYSEPKISIE